MSSGSEDKTPNTPFQCEICDLWFRHLVNGACESCRDAEDLQGAHGDACDCSDCCP